MTPEQANRRLLRWLLGGMGVCLIACAAAVVWLGSVTVHGRFQPQPTTYTGNDALHWAALYACCGIALFGVYARKPAYVGLWMGLWLIAGIAAVLVPAYFS